MPQHFTIANFKFGLDSRRSELTSVPGTLLVCENAHINQGAQAEKRKAFVKLGTLPNGCIGLQETSTGLVTYGSAAAPAMPVGLQGLVTYTRLRHPYWQIDSNAPQYNSHLNPNSLVEPSLSSIVHSCAYGGFDFAIASFTAEQGTGGDTFDDLFSDTFYYYKGNVLLNCLQGRCDFMKSSAFITTSIYLAMATQFAYYASDMAGSIFTFLPQSLGVNFQISCQITGPLNTPFSIVVSDTSQAITTSVQTTASAPVDAVGATTTIYFTKAAAGTKNISVLTAPNVVNGAVSGTVNLIPAGTVTFDTSIYQTVVKLANAINASNTGYTAQATYLGAVVASLVITAPPTFGAVVNASNVTITTSNLFVSATPLQNSGAEGASTTFALAAGVTQKQGTGQTSLLIFNQGEVPISMGSYQADLVYNGLTYNLGRTDLTTSRATAAFFVNPLATGSGGDSLNSITLPDGTNLLNAAVPWPFSVNQFCLDICTSINAKWNPTVGVARYSDGAGHTRNDNTWLAYTVFGTNTDGTTVPGVVVVAPPGEQYNDVKLVVNLTTIPISSAVNGPFVGGGASNTPLPIVLGSDYPAKVSGTFVMALGGKLYMARGTRFGFSASFDCTKWNRQDTGAGSVQNLDFYSAPSDIICTAPYQGKLAVFGRRNVSIWQVNADPAQYAQSQSLPNIGTFAKLSVQPLGDLDVLFLSDTGVRSLRVRDNTLNAFVNDIGSPIDDFITASLIANSATANAAACAIVEPGSGRYWLHLNGTIYVLSYYPSLKIIAWSTYLPTYDVGGVQTAFVPVKFLTYNGQVYVLDSNSNVYVYGGTDNNTYDGCVATVQSPWMDLKSPHMNKNSLRLNVAMAGEWQVQAGMDPRAGDLMTVVEANPAATGSEPTDSTFDESSFAWSRYGSHFQFKATTASTWKQAALFSSITLQYNPGRDE